MGWLNSVSKAAESNIVFLGAKVLAAGLVCYFAGAFLYVAISRMGYMFTLEWLEGASLIAVRQLLAGHPLYAQPTFQYVPLIYSPLYYYVSALFATVLGSGSSSHTTMPSCYSERWRLATRCCAFRTSIVGKP